MRQPLGDVTGSAPQPCFRCRVSHIGLCYVLRTGYSGSKNSLAAVPHSAAGMRLAQVCSRLQQEGMPAEEVTVATPAPAGWYQYFQETLSA